MKKLLLSITLVALWPWPACALTPTQAVAAALTDLDTQAVEDQPFLRYLYLPVARGAPGTRVVDYVGPFNQALRFHVNLISREAALAYPKMVADGVWRVDLRDYQWDPKVWEKLADIDPYFHRKQVVDTVEVVDVKVRVVESWPGGYWTDGAYYQAGAFQTERYVVKQEKRVTKSAKVILYTPQGAAQLAGLALLTNSQQPIARADWFLVQGARQLSLRNQETGAGYYDWLGLKSRDDYFKLIGQDDRAVLKTQSEIRAVVGESGVADQNRQVLREGATTGGHWTTLEVFDQSGRGVAINNLRRGELLHDAEEHYAPLPNGLPVMLASDAKGVLQATVPDKVAGNRSSLNTSNDLRVHVNISCIQCHSTGVLQPIEDDVRPVYTGRLVTITNDKGLALELARQYGANLTRVLNRDSDEYADVYHRVGGKTVKETSVAYSEAFTRYAYGRVTAEDAAREYGVTEGQFLKALRDAAVRLGRSDFRLDPFLATTKRTVPRLNFEDAYQTGNDLLYGILDENPPERKND